MADRLPVTVLSGFPGAGKTTLLNHLLAHGAGGRVGVLVCGAQDGQTLAPLPPGCEATVLPSAEALLAETARLAAEGRFDALLVEADGLDEPLAIAEGFLFEAEHGAGPEAAVQPDTLVTVIDAATFLRDLNEAEFLADRGLAQGLDDDRTVAEVLVAQVECCDVIVLNKADLAGAADLAQLHAVLRALNPRADIVQASFGKVPPERVQGTGRFDFEAAADAPGWLAVLRDEVPTNNVSGVSTLVYRRRRPFHPQRFADLIHTEWLREHGSVLRSRGLFWLASRMDTAGDWNQSGGVCRHGGAGAWWAALDPAEWPADTAERAEVEADMQIGGAPAPFGDRRQELVLIGLDMNQAALQARLDACLLTDAEMAAGTEAWATYADPFPGWVDEFDDDHDHAHGHDHDHGDDCGCGDPDHHHGNHGDHPHAH
ncbi:cobalamin (vitamin B12) synthesis [Cupriavidus necator]|uniref:Cobalamin (Vitamin B12) synthesis n=1 Tax=Cupriavidus necator TaxID=106590 RepID=A0A1U9UIN5_CUPNE|nr:GTP-binding protein [Cupriavidus necator]AQV92449.1 cobalamin (vitamin B12) synthesis [Cupriavidus necator]